MKEKIFTEITNYYLQSRDFNGLPLGQLDNDQEDLICELIDEGKIEVLSSNFVLNPHIKALKLDIDKEEQKRAVKDRLGSVVLYPTEKHLKSMNLFTEKPFTKMLMEGKEQLDILFFDIEILESYFQNPKYIVFSSDYRGSIVTSDDFVNEDLEGEYIKDFGIGYHKKKGNHERVVGVFERFSGTFVECSIKMENKLLGKTRRLLYKQWLL